MYYMDIMHTKLLTVTFVAMANRLPGQQSGISILELSEGIGTVVAADLKHDFYLCLPYQIGYHSNKMKVSI